MQTSKGALLVAGLLAAVSANAATVLFDFGAGTNISSPYPGSSNAINGAALTIGTQPILLDGGILEVTGSGSLTCVTGATANTCGTPSTDTGSTAAGLGVSGGSDNRLDGTETITITLLNHNYTVSLVSFGLTAFTSGETATYKADSGAANTLSATGTGLQIDTLGSQLAFTNTLTFAVGTGNYDLGQVSLNITQNAVPEPATFGLVGIALAGIGLVRRRKRA